MNLSTYTIRHYPTHLIDVWSMRNGTKIIARPVLPQDGPMLSDMIERASQASRIHRFHSPINGLTLARQRDMTEVDYQTHLALVLTVATSEGNRIIGEGRYVVDDTPDRHCATFALSIVDDWQQRGLGTRTMTLLMDAARGAGVRWLHGDVMQDNLAMLKLMRRVGFSCTPNRNRERLIDAEALLDNAGGRAIQPTLKRRFRSLRHFARA
ncbi:GNAT family N-acetyltransferase [Pararobbsia silviterrae]|uniref:GNAT family N-acetyltransferase n=1 Tax=Pararobbsia silviterrae TaxID=1792498 RepID=UPI00131436BC|nr:GNAT family N-acetyltransferase [Pararobbsia silviterrae]